MDPSSHQPDEMADYLGSLMHRRRVESSSTLLQHFSLKEDPFGVNPDPRYMYPSKTHLEALASLENGFYNNRGFIAMIAPPGMGKTTLLYRFLEDTQATARSVFLFDIDTECKPRDFVGYILRDFGVTPARSSSEMHKQLGEVLVRETEAGRKCVVVIDEAQNLSDAVLERVRLITNFETSQGKLLQIIFSGQPQLTNKLMQESLIQLRQRVSTFCRLELLTAQETAEYIDFRLKQAGYGGEPLFTEDALKLIAETSKGTPRTINNLCFNALALCCTMQSKQVDGGMVAKIAANLELVSKADGSIETVSGSADEPPSVRKLWKQFRQMVTLWGQAADNRMKLWVPATAAVLLLSALGVLKLSGIADTQPRNVDNERPLSTNVSTEPVPSPTVAKTRKNLSAKTAPNTKPFAMGMAAGRLSASSLAAAKRGAAPAQASLSINCIPTGADIEIDGAFVGNTPSIVSVVPGTHQITVKKSGYTGWSKTLSVTGGTIQLNAELEPEPAKQ